MYCEKKGGNKDVQLTLFFVKYKGGGGEKYERYCGGDHRSVGEIIGESERVRDRERERGGEKERVRERQRDSEGEGVRGRKKGRKRERE